MSADGRTAREPVFLRAEWRTLAMLNFEVERAILAPSIPAGTELDDWSGRAVVSVVGLVFRRTRVLGLPVPFHRSFDEVNLRFYVRRRGEQGWRHGIVFVEELVPRAAVTWAARTLYGENYSTARVRHETEASDARRLVRYLWSRRGGEGRMELVSEGSSDPAAPGSEAEFITDRPWGYTRRGSGWTQEYRVAHPRWNVWIAQRASVEGETLALFGQPFAPFLAGAPRSAFLADGSEVAVHAPHRLR